MHRCHTTPRTHGRPSLRRQATDASAARAGHPRHTCDRDDAADYAYYREQDRHAGNPLELMAGAVGTRGGALVLAWRRSGKELVLAIHAIDLTGCSPQQRHRITVDPCTPAAGGQSGELAGHQPLACGSDSPYGRPFNRSSASQGAHL
jgi:hypothetical protein